MHIPAPVFAWAVTGSALALCLLAANELLRAARGRADTGTTVIPMPWLERFRGNRDLLAFMEPQLREAAIFVLCLVLGLVAAAFGHLTIPRALLMALFATAAIGIAIHAVTALETDPMELQSGWGGLGGGLGGWRLSRPTVLILLALAFAGAAVVSAAQPKAAERAAPVAPVVTRTATGHG